MTNEELFNDKFPDEVSNIEFFGKSGRITCMIYRPSGRIVPSVPKENIYDAFADAYKRMKENEIIQL